jgi:hypothetical protein
VWGNRSAAAATPTSQNIVVDVEAKIAAKKGFARRISVLNAPNFPAPARGSGSQYLK